MSATYTQNTRTNMLNSQILTGHVLEPRLLGALMNVAREAFVPESLQGTAYVDEEIPLGKNRFLMEPLVFARLLSHAQIQAHETVLDVSVGTGYSSAVLSTLAQKVIAVEEDATLAQKAKSLLAPYSNVAVVQASVAGGVSKESPYDVIIIEGAIEILPQTLTDQLREGGRLLTVEHDADSKIAAAGLGKLVEYKKVRGTLYKTILRDASVAVLPAFKKSPAFIF